MAGYEIKGKTISLVANADMKGKKFTPVKVVANDTFGVAENLDTVVGVLQNEVIKGEAGQIMINGVTPYVCTETVAAGAAVGNWGIALQGGNAGEIISVLIK